MKDGFIIPVYSGKTDFGSEFIRQRAFTFCGDNTQGRPRISRGNIQLVKPDPDEKAIVEEWALLLYN